jgi:4-aminobutyrate aminotransferase/(S)-3-amino-2-methylpropionate transaminase
VVKRAKNSTLWDLEGKEYIDFAGGIGALNVGHSHPKVVEALKVQAAEFTHTSFHVASYPQYTAVCEKLSAIAPGDNAKKAALFNSGSEAVENAVKLARSYTKRNAIISFGYAFHGRTLLCLTLDGREKVLKSGFGPFAPGVYRAPFPYPYRPPKGILPNQLTDYCLGELERLWRSEISPEDTAALIVEPVQGEGGFIVPMPGFLKGLRKLCDHYGIVLIVDEVQSGFGRTGKFWGFEHDGIIPDLVAAGKSLAAGMPLSAVVGRAEIMDSAPVGAIGGTYGGNPLACAAALAVFDIFEKEKILEHAVLIGEIVQKRFDSFYASFPLVGDSRGLGAMRALELVTDRNTKAPLPPESVKKIISECAENGLLIIKAGIFDNVLRTLMPLTIPRQDLEKGLDILESVLKKNSQGKPVK